MKIFALTTHGPGFYFAQVSPVEWHTVDLRAFNGNGSCTCATFYGCCKFLLQHQGESGKRWRCDHILAVRDWVMEHEVPALIERTEKIVEMPLPNERHLADTGL